MTASECFNTAYGGLKWTHNCTINWWTNTMEHSASRKALPSWEHKYYLSVATLWSGTCW